MTHQPDIWTGDVRRVLYTRLVRRFGPSDKWKKTSSPGGGRDQDFKDFCEAFAKVVGAKSGNAVKHQIRFAITETEHGSNLGRHSQTAILNKAAALEMGFINDSQLPNLLAVRRPSEKGDK
ncbi:MAG: hypothetical protein ABSG88_21980 [Bradyrhizobium sp.]